MNEGYPLIDANVNEIKFSITDEERRYLNHLIHFCQLDGNSTENKRLTTILRKAIHLCFYHRNDLNKIALSMPDDADLSSLPEFSITKKMKQNLFATPNASDEVRELQMRMAKLEKDCKFACDDLRQRNHIELDRVYNKIESLKQAFKNIK